MRRASASGAHSSPLKHQRHNQRGGCRSGGPASEANACGGRIGIREDVTNETIIVGAIAMAALPETKAHASAHADIFGRSPQQSHGASAASALAVIAQGVSDKAARERDIGVAKAMIAQSARMRKLGPLRDIAVRYQSSGWYVNLIVRKGVKATCSRSVWMSAIALGCDKRPTARRPL